MKDVQSVADGFGNSNQVTGKAIADALRAKFADAPQLAEKIELPEAGFEGINHPSYMELFNIREEAHVNIIAGRYEEVFAEVRQTIAKQQADIDNAPQRKEEAKKEIDKQLEELNAKNKEIEDELEAKNTELQNELNALLEKINSDPDQKAFFEEYSKEMNDFYTKKTELETKLNVQIADLRRNVTALIASQERTKQELAKKEEARQKQERLDKKKKDKEEPKKAEKPKPQNESVEQEETFNDLKGEIKDYVDEDAEIELVVPPPDKIIPIKLITQEKKKADLPKKIKTIFDAIALEDIEDVKGFLPKCVNDVADQRVTPIILATKMRNFDIFKLLVDNGANLNAQDATGRTAFHYAAANFDTNIINVLSENKAKANLRDSQKQTPLDIVKDRETSAASLTKAAQEGDSASISRVLRKYPDLVTNKYDSGMTLLHIAAGFNKPNACQTILSWGADINAVNDDGDTPLHLAVQFEAKRAAKFLLEHGADATIKNKKGKLALELQE